MVGQWHCQRIHRPWQGIKGLIPWSRWMNTNAPKPKKSFLPAYDAKTVEAGWYDWWESQGFFKASSADYHPQNNSKNESFTMITPPPNVTGSLHIGHALTLSVEDCIARWRRMSGFNVKWIPGTDHAGIGTQSVVERMLMKDRQCTRHDLGREAFIDQVWAWREKYGNHILHQMRRMGASVAWQDTYFTMDKTRSNAVQNAFIRLYEDGLIYRDTRLVNWCCALETVISDIEVEHKEIDGRTLLSIPGHPHPVEYGVLHSFRYPVIDADPDGPQHLTVSTTRIETILGDCAVAIHPNDPRYQALHGKFVRHPIHGHPLPIITDADLVDMAFGTGAVKVTPAHDPADYACGRRHGLPMINILDKLGKLNNHGGVPEWEGLDRFDVRERVVEKLRQLGHYEGRNETHAMRVAICSRSGDVIEPLLQPQWYIRCQPLANAAKKMVETGEMEIYPNWHVGDWFRWLDNIQDWCVSRQLWWGHDIPAYRVQANVQDGKDVDEWIVAQNELQAREQARALLTRLGLSTDTPFELVKDTDVLDTWFSSGLLPLSALGWQGTRDEVIPQQYPLQLMETGHDILFFWVARMAMLAGYFSEQTPFEKVFLHAMVRDSQGRKMSKSLGNVIDPLHVIDGVDLETLKDNIRRSNLPPKEINLSVRNLHDDYPQGIPPCGTDALRMALVTYTQQSRQINLDMPTVIQTSHFCNKLWNLVKFGIGHLRTQPPHAIDTLGHHQLSLADRYILSRMATTVRRCNDSFAALRPFDAADVVRRFILEDLCDVYVEFSKSILNQASTDNEALDTTRSVLYACLEGSLRLVHPFMPFVTEELWQHVNDVVAPLNGHTNPPSIMVAPYPRTEQWKLWCSDEVENHFKVILGLIHASRSFRQSHHISVRQELPIHIWCNDSTLLGAGGPLRLYLNEIKGFVRASALSVTDDLESVPRDRWTEREVTSSLKIFVSTDELIKAQKGRAAAGGIDPSKRLSQAQKQLFKLRQDMERLTERINHTGYVQSAPEKIQIKNRQRYERLSRDIKRLENDVKLWETALVQ